MDFVFSKKIFKIAYNVINWTKIKWMSATVALSEYEIERGKPMPDKNHALIQGNLFFLIRLFYSEKYTVLPEINLDLPIRERIPDLAIYPAMKFHPDENEIRMKEAPLCAIEILSAKQDLSELMTKRAEYFTGGVLSYWLVLPALYTIYVFHSATEYQIFSGKDILQDSKLGIELNLEEVFK
jgi:Uma2 family endonuclease